MKKILIASALMLSLISCGVQNNVTFSSTMGQCADGTSGAPYCAAVTIQNNTSGQNWINSTNFPISGLSLTVSGAENVNYPKASGSSYDPNNCWGSTINPGSSCTFYLQLSGESVAVGQKAALNLTANYTINNNLFGGNASTSSSSVILYELPSLLIATSSGMVESYNNNGLSSSFHAESGEVVANANSNDNYYGFLYLAGNNGIYLSGNGNYVLNATNSSTTITGAGNLPINGTTLYATPNNLATFATVYSAGIQHESFTWQSYASGLPTSLLTNTAANNGNQVFVASSSAVYLCGLISGSTTTGCNQEGLVFASSNITTLAYNKLGNLADGTSLTGVVVGATTGLWVESGTLGSASNPWTQVMLNNDSSQLITSQIVEMTGDNNQNLYIADINNKIYKMVVNGSNNATVLAQLALSSGVTIAALVYDNAGQLLYVAASNGAIYTCSAATASCSSAPVTTAFSSGIMGLNIVTSLTSS